MEKAMDYLNGLSHTGHFVRGLQADRNPSTVLQELQMKWPFSQVFPPLTSFSFPQASHVRFISLFVG
jgi:hypothetical protein